jgi:hypothetical protein
MELNDELREKINVICERISDGESVRSILKDKIPFARSTFYCIVSENKDIADQYARAMLERQEALFEEILTIADSQENDIVLSSDGVEVINHNVIQRNRLQIDARKWNLSRMNPKKYGDKVDVNHSGEIKDIHQIELIDVETTDSDADPSEEVH